MGKSKMRSFIIIFFLCSNVFALDSNELSSIFKRVDEMFIAYQKRDANKYMSYISDGYITELFQNKKNATQAFQNERNQVFLEEIKDIKFNDQMIIVYIFSHHENGSGSFTKRHFNRKTLLVDKVEEWNDKRRFSFKVGRLMLNPKSFYNRHGEHRSPKTKPNDESVSEN
jgi:hypothetical protein